MNNTRSNRKKEHLLLARQGPRCSFPSLFEDILLPHDCLTTVAPEDTDLSACYSGIQAKTPLYINAITGGSLASEAINRNLGLLAREFGLPMALGSMQAGLDNPRFRFTYRVVRRVNPQGVVLANLPAGASLAQARAAVDLVEAQALQLFLNPLQEFIMPEGEGPSPGLLENLAEICAGLKVPVLVKETGFGIGPDQARALAQAGARGVDISGTGGTNFARIEGRRSSSDWWRPLARWGLPTPLALAAVVARGPALDILASGGVDDGIRALKCLCLGAKAVGVAGGLLGPLGRGGLAAAGSYLADYLRQLRTGLALLGQDSLAGLTSLPLVVSGRLGEMLAGMGIDLSRGGPGT
jgi:isopentenyl-diphosphate delta-isomerase